MELLSHLCQQEQIKCVTIDGRLKSPHRIWKKLIKYQTNDIGKIMDILAFRIVSESVGDCYNMLGIIHKYYTPIFSKMKDYIALPKPNGYKSLHTTVLGMFNFPVEIQVRTQRMDQIANYGVAAHFAYSDANRSVVVSDKQAYWIEKMQEIVKKYQASPDKEHFKDELNIEILQKNIFIYTPK
jgi:GTP pyrophosphokinase